MSCILLGFNSWCGLLTHLTIIITVIIFSKNNIIILTNFVPIVTINLLTDEATFPTSPKKIK